MTCFRINHWQSTRSNLKHVTVHHGQIAAGRVKSAECLHAAKCEMPQIGPSCDLVSDISAPQEVDTTYYSIHSPDVSGWVNRRTSHASKTGATEVKNGRVEAKALSAG